MLKKLTRAEAHKAGKIADLMFGFAVFGLIALIMALSLFLGGVR